MRKAAWHLIALLLLAPAVRAQVPALLLGRWQVYELGFVAEAQVPDSVREQLNDPQVADLNIAIMRGETSLVVEFRPNGSHEFAITRADQQVRREVGTYELKNGHLLAISAAPDGASFHNQHVVRLTKRTLVLAFPVGERLPGVVEEIEYHHLKSRQTSLSPQSESETVDAIKAALCAITGRAK